MEHQYPIYVFRHDGYQWYYDNKSISSAIFNLIESEKIIKFDESHKGLCIKFFKSSKEAFNAYNKAIMLFY